MRTKPLIPTLIFSICLLIFGVFGYLKTGSKMSLYSSLTFGTLLLSSCLGMGLRKKWGFYSARILTALLSAMFIFRSVITHKPVPIALAVVSCAMFLFLISKSANTDESFGF